MTTFIAIVLMFGVLISVHEWGHLVMAKRAGILCHEFAIGFGPKILSFRKNETLYTIRLLPIGGYVKMAGEDFEPIEVKAGQHVGLRLTNAGTVDRVYFQPDQAKDVHVVGTVDKFDSIRELKIQLLVDDEVRVYSLERDTLLVDQGMEIQIAPYDRTFGAQSVWKRVLAIAAGPAMNFVLAFILLVIVGLVQGTPTDDGQIGTVQPDSAADQAGLMTGDEIVSIEGQPIDNWLDLRTVLADRADTPTEVTYIRDDAEQTVTLTPQAIEQNGETVGILGVTNALERSPTKAFTTGAETTWTMSTLIFSAVGDLVTGQVGVDQLAGPVGIVRMTDEVAASGLIMLLNWTALLSVNLAIFNLLPLPALDGGRLLFLLFEAVRGRPMDPKKEGFVHFIGFALLMLLMLIVTWNDIQSFFK
ncbi:RIP metalloprotease RseP [Exiguobacterium sp. SL-10]|uniref:RIP metalloprotease RseP n=1 Tax=Exiguobacterium sp. SL-10 TaxID=2510962 RepID=UPI00103BD3D7|nr:RIP metalloprotease RseP [Exiguobacterium sp. SL-10]TCI31883.1 RIP metalloprotease RseP [Exiguobacterium sp. SL-10]